jgi:hypothetical protein
MPRRKRTPAAQPVAAAYLAVLTDEGYRPKVEDVEGGCTTIAFNAEGTRFLLFALEDDPEYFRLGAGFELGGSRDPAVLAAVANDVNERTKGVKAVLDPERNGVRFMVETFLTGQRVTGALVAPATGAIQTAANDFFGARRRAPEHLDA